MPSSLQGLPVELLATIFQLCDSGKDMVSLACTCQRLRDVFDDYGLLIKIPIFAEQFGPLDEIIRVVTQPVGRPDQSFEDVQMVPELLNKVTMVVNVAAVWVDNYLHSNGVITRADKQGHTTRAAVDKHKMRLAVYRLWRYYRAFHCPPYNGSVIEQSDVVELRCQLLRQWNHDELFDMYQISCFMRTLIQRHVCPDTDAMIERHYVHDPNSQFYKVDHYNFPRLCPETPHPGPLLPADAALATTELYFLAPPPSFVPRVYKSIKTAIYLSPTQTWDRRGSFAYLSLLDDVMKLDFGQILWLGRCAPYREQVRAFLSSLDGDWFEDNEETFVETLRGVLAERNIYNYIM